MDWFLYDIGLRHERVKFNLEKSGKNWLSYSEMYLEASRAFSGKTLTTKSCSLFSQKTPLKMFG